MALAAKRVMINAPTYMQIDGQWQIVLSGTVVDLTNATDLTGTSIDPTFNESAGNLSGHGGGTPVRNVRVR